MSHTLLFWKLLLLLRKKTFTNLSYRISDEFEIIQLVFIVTLFIDNKFKITVYIEFVVYFQSHNAEFHCVLMSSVYFENNIM